MAGFSGWPTEIRLWLDSLLCPLSMEKLDMAVYAALNINICKKGAGATLGKEETTGILKFVEVCLTSAKLDCGSN